MQLLKVVFILLCSSAIYSGELFVDQFHLLQKRVAIKYEKKIDIHESVLFGVNIFNDQIDNVDYGFSLYDFTYRRYVVSQESGVFYSFGFRYGPVSLKSNGVSENENLYMPYYDVGVKTKLSSRWSHSIKVEAGYVMLYTSDINVDYILGLQFTPFFSFGYQL